MTLKHRIVIWLRKFGIELRRYQPNRHPVARRIRLIENSGVNVVLDVGANVGEFGEELRNHGYRGRIISFEPLDEAFGHLEERASGDPDWILKKIALGNESGRKVIHIANNVTSSSILDMLPSHHQAAPQSKYIGEREIHIERLDNLFSTVVEGDNTVWLKIDTQGYEKSVLEGASNSLNYCTFVQLEVSLVPLYKGSSTMDEILSYMTVRGFEVVGIEPGFSDNETGQLLQADFTFRKV